MSKLLKCFVLIVSISFCSTSCCVKLTPLDPSNPKLLNILNIGAFFEADDNLERAELLKQRGNILKELLDTIPNGSLSQDYISQLRLQESIIKTRLKKLDDRDKIIKFLQEPTYKLEGFQGWLIGPRPLPNPCKCNELRMKEGLIIFPLNVDVKKIFIEINGTKIAESGPITINNKLGVNVMSLKIRNKYEGQEAMLSLSYLMDKELQNMKTKVMLR